MRIAFVDEDGNETTVTRTGGTLRRPPTADAARSPGTDPRHKPTPEGDALDPTRYLDWEKNGQCIDF